MADIQRFGARLSCAFEFLRDCTASAQDDVPCGFDARFTFSIGLWKARGLVVFRVLFMNSSFPCL